MDNEIEDLKKEFVYVAKKYKMTKEVLERLFKEVIEGAEKGAEAFKDELKNNSQITNYIEQKVKFTEEFDRLFNMRLTGNLNERKFKISVIKAGKQSGLTGKQVDICLDEIFEQYKVKYPKFFK